MGDSSQSAQLDNNEKGWKSQMVLEVQIQTWSGSPAVINES